MIVPLLIAFAVLTAIYVILRIWARSVRRENLEEDWDEEGREGDREAFIEEGLAEYDRSLRKKLILGVYVVPVALVVILIYLVNYR